MKSLLAGLICLFVLGILCAAPARVSAQSDPSAKPDANLLSEPEPSHYDHELEEALDARPKPPAKWGINGVLRYSFLSDNAAASRFAEYSQLWDDGIGGGVELYRDLLEGSYVRLGPYASLGVDVFGGGDHSGADNRVGLVEVQTDAMTVWTGILGVRLESANRRQDKYVRGGFYWEAHAGGGFGYIPSVDADLTFVSLGNLHFNNERFYEDTFTWAVEGGGRVGYGARNWSIYVGGGVRLYGQPDSNNRLDADASNLMTFPVEVGMEFRF